MHPFIHIDAESVEDTLPLLDETSRPFAGGTDMLPLLKDRLVAPQRLINIKRAEELRYITVDGDRARIGALTTLSELERHADLLRDYTALSQAAAQSASPQLRNMATIGGNLLQQVRCWYYRSDAHCWLKGGDTCFARDGRNEFHAIFEQSPCVAVYPSDPPAALIALDASLVIQGPRGERSESVAEFLQPPTEQHRMLHALAPDELIVAVDIPKPRGRSVYLKAMDRAAWAYALASVAAVAEIDGEIARNVRIVIGGVANTPIRASATEDLLEGQALTDDLLKRAGAAAIDGAQALEHNRYKLPLVRNLVIQALRDLMV